MRGGGEAFTWLPPLCTPCPLGRARENWPLCCLSPGATVSWGLTPEPQPTDSGPPSPASPPFRQLSLVFFPFLLLNQPPANRRGVVCECVGGLNPILTPHWPFALFGAQKHHPGLEKPVLSSAEGLGLQRELVELDRVLAGGRGWSQSHRDTPKYKATPEPLILHPPLVSFPSRQPVPPHQVVAPFKLY